MAVIRDNSQQTTANVAIVQNGERKTVATCMASMADVSGRDFYAAQAYQAQDIVTFGIRWRDDLCKEWRIVHRGSVYQIEQINHLGYRRDFIHVKARMTTGEGA